MFFTRTTADASSPAYTKGGGEQRSANILSGGDRIAQYMCNLPSYHASSIVLHCTGMAARPSATFDRELDRINVYHVDYSSQAQNGEECEKETVVGEKRDGWKPWNWTGVIKFDVTTPHPAMPFKICSFGALGSERLSYSHTGI